ncbi:vWA domain-containing protein [Thermincola potens]|uniref:von Willebrand factor type A n=1 Tax=Thermincola potens (strain JR) TaxID=635013 RepID=D5X9N9_THEPJ|nr:VWA domain-containing protein [Thermincola potens]ADG81110.1 von Willebrand factor type A [Thermincola potens JR]
MESRERHQRMTLEHYLSYYFSQNKGVRLGETTVVSNKVHSNHPATPGHIKIYIDQDAGQTYLGREEANQILHIDVFHEPARLDPVYVARRIWGALETYFNQLRDERRSELTKDECRQIVKELSEKIYVKTAGGQGTVFQLASRKGEISTSKNIIQNHVHVLAELECKYYDSLIFMVDAIEAAIINQGFEIRRVEALDHCEKEIVTEKGTGVGVSLPGFNSPEAKAHIAQQNRLQIILDLASAFGTIEEAKNFLESLTATGNIFLGSFAKKHGDGDLKQTLLDLCNHNLVKKGRFTHTLTDEGKELLEFIKYHQKELEAQVRKSIRKYQIVRHNYQTYHNSELKSRKSQLTDERRVVGLDSHAWLGELAIPETVVAATARSFLQGQRHMSIKREDIRQYGRKSFAPIDTCLAIDCSGSMVGEKIRAVAYLAQHFLLTSREKVSVVTFQETSSKVVIPFTKSYQKLVEGLRSIQPEGMTPLAKGILEAVELIKKKRARNPLLVLITDGIPNYPLWTTDAQADALKAAEMIAENKIRLVCIGVLPNESFLKELAKIGKGNLYIVDELDKNSLLDVVTQEWQRYKYSK